MKEDNKTGTIHDILNSDAFHDWYCGEFTNYSVGAKGAPDRAKIDTAITRHFRKLYVKTADEQDAPKAKTKTPKAVKTKPATPAKPTPAAKETKAKGEARINLTIEGDAKPAEAPVAEVVPAATPVESTSSALDNVN